MSLLILLTKLNLVTNVYFVSFRTACQDYILNDGFELEGDLVIYKIGDLGHVTSVSDPQKEEGDCRYLSLDALNADFKHLFKADMFALGMTLYEAGGGGPLPKNGTEWQKLRHGEVPDLKCLSKDFNNLIKVHYLLRHKIYRYTNNNQYFSYYWIQIQPKDRHQHQFFNILFYVHQRLNQKLN